MKNCNTIKLLAPIAVAGFIIVYFAFLVRHTTNIPNTDDFWMFLDSALWFHEATGNDKITTLFRTHGEHYIVLCRLLAIVLTYVPGEINFKVIIVIGNLALVACAVLLVLKAKSAASLSPFVVATPAIVLLFQPQFYQALLWASAAIEHLWIMPLVLGAFYFVDRPLSVASVFLQLLCMLLALFTQGNGVFCPLALGIIYLARGQAKAAMTWTLIFFLSLSLHQSTMPSVLSVVLQRTGNLIQYTLSFVGASIAPTFFSSIVAGGFLVALFLFLVVKKSALKREPFFSALALFVLFTAGANALARIDFGVTFAFLESRYRYPGLFLILALYFLMLNLLVPERKKSGIVHATFFISVILCVLSYLKYLPEYVTREELLTDSIALYKFTGGGLETAGHDEEAESILVRSIERDFYMLPESSDVPAELASVPHPPAMNESRQAVLERSLQRNCILGIRGHVIPGKGASSVARAQSLILQGAGVYQNALSPRTRADVVRSFRRRNASLRSGFFSLSSLRGLPDDTYHLSIKLSDGSYAPTRKKIIVAGCA